MRGKERIKLAFAHKEADRVPLFEAAFSSRLASEILGREVFLPSSGGSSFRHFIRASMAGQRQLTETAERSAKDAIALFSELGMDMLRVRITDFLAPVDFGFGNYGANFLFDVKIQEIRRNQWRIESPEGFWSEHIYEENSDAMTCSSHSIMSGGLAEFSRWVDLLEQQPTEMPVRAIPGLAGVRAAVEEAEKAGLFVLGWGDVAYPGSSPFLTTFLTAMHFEPELITRYMEATTKGALTFITAQLEAGVDGIIGGNDWCFRSGPMFSPEHFAKFFVPSLKKIADLCHAYDVPYIKHLDGNTMKLLDMLVDDVGIDGHHPLEPAAGMDIIQLKKKYGKKITLLGNLDCGELLSHGTEEAVIAQTRKILRVASPGGGHVFSSSNSIHDGVKLKNLFAMIDTVKEYGQYPIQ